MTKPKAAALLVVLSMPFWHLGHPLWEVDDARYAEVPREMHLSGNATVPTLNGMDYIEKPPLIYWLGAASYSVFGVGEAAARFPLALTAVTALLGVWWLGGWLFSPAAGAAAALVLGSSLLFAGLSHMLTPDLALSAALLWATGLGLRTMRRPEDARWAAPAAWAAMAAAFLAKGLIALVLPGVWAAALALMFPELRRGFRRLLLDWGALLFLAVVGCWLWRMETAAPGFCRVFFLEQHFQRFLDTGKYNRPGPWWFFLATDLWGMLPWAPAAAAALVVPLASPRRSDPRTVQLALWSLIVIAFFSSSSSKLVTYLLPALPQQAVLAAELLGRSRPRWMARAGAALAAVLLCAAAAAPLAAGRVPGVDAASTAFAAAALALFAVGTLLASRGALAQAALASAGAMAVCLAGASRFEPQLSARPVALELNRRLAAAGPEETVRLVAYDRYLHGVPFYTGRTVDVVNWVGELHYAKRFARFAHRFGDDDEIREWPLDGERVLVTLPERELDWLVRTRGGPASVKDVVKVGPTVVLELAPTARPARPGSGAGPKPAP
ncbi:MAG: glycosyltransferase family 39 protein [Elusimicrobia bacterium]|nr:glycosyltransferase family 39 protein [Elusimicrobiota bacterium]